MWIFLDFRRKARTLQCAEQASYLLRVQGESVLLHVFRVPRKRHLSSLTCAEGERILGLNPRLRVRNAEAGVLSESRSLNPPKEFPVDPNPRFDDRDSKW